MRRISTTTFRIARRGTCAGGSNRQIALNLCALEAAPLPRRPGAAHGGSARRDQPSWSRTSFARSRCSRERRERASVAGKPRHLYIEIRRRCAMAVDISGWSHPDARDRPPRPPPPGRAGPDPSSSGGPREEAGPDIERILPSNPEVGEWGLGVGTWSRAPWTSIVGGHPLCSHPGWRDLDLRSRGGGDRPARGGGELREGLRAGPGVGGARHAPVDGTVAT